MSRKKKSTKPHINLAEKIVNGLIDLIVGIILVLLEEYIK